MKLTLLTAALALLLSSCSISDVANAAKNAVHSQQTISSADSSPLKTVNIKVSGFKEIEASRALTVDYIQGPKTQVSLTAPEDIIEYITIESDGETLDCYIKDNYQIRSGLDRVRIAVIAPSVREFEASTASTINIGDGYAMPKSSVDLTVSTAATINAASIISASLGCDASTSGTINAGNLNIGGETEADASTSGTIILSGITASVDFEASTSGTIRAASLVAKTGSAESSTAGTIRCNVANPTNFSKSTGGSVTNTRK